MKTKTSMLHWTVLDAIVRQGSFSRAAKALHMSQSSISYTVAQLQDLLGVRLLELEGRRATLTEQGLSLLNEAQPLLEGFHALEQRSQILALGGETQLGITVDSIYPEQLLFDALGVFRKSHPHVHLDLHRDIRTSPDDAFELHKAQLCIATHAPGRYLSQHLLDVMMIAVAHRDHPLHLEKQRLSASHLARHLMVTITITSNSAASTFDVAIPGVETWNVNTISAAIAAVRSGSCFGWLPADRLEPYLASGEIRRLDLTAGSERRIPLFLITPQKRASGPAANSLAGILKDSTAAWSTTLANPSEK